jgi:SAM-dependent methyltransferase
VKVARSGKKRSHRRGADSVAHRERGPGAAPSRTGPGAPRPRSGAARSGAARPPTARPLTHPAVPVAAPSRGRPPAALPSDELDEWSTRPVRDRPQRGRERSPRFERPPRREPLLDEPGPTGPRRPLSHVGGRVERLEGPSELLEIVQRGLAIDPEQGVRDHVHGFHSYPARLHPVTAAHLISGLSKRRGSVADPFCGCGTVLVEARRLERKAIGVDLNPLAVRLTRFKTQPLVAEQRSELLLAATRVAEHAEERRLAAAGPTHRYAPVQREAFDVHVLLELDGLAHGIKQEEPGFLRQSLNLALSSIFSKVARDMTAEGPSKRLASGFTIRFFASRVGELVRQLAEYEALLPEKAPGITVREADARELSSLGLSNVELFVSSPPYPGVLDYAEYHRTRLSWLNIDASEFERLEMGARRHLQRLDHERAAAVWEADFGKVLAAMREALAPGGHIAIVLADSLLAGKPYPADVVVERCARRAGLALLARGSQRRPHFHRQSAKAFGDRPRYEHLLILAPAAR